MMMRLIFMLVLAAQALGATYYVAITGSNSNPGTIGSPWLTGTYAAAHSSAGDTIRVQAGLYNEKVVISAGGTAGNYKNFVADGAVINCGFLVGADYIRIIGFEITHTNAVDFNDGILFVSNSSHCEIIDNNIHDIHATHGGIVGLSGGQPDIRWPVVRGNRIYNLGIVNGVVVDDPSLAIGSMYETPFTSTNVIKADHWLVEYNGPVQWTGDYANIFGTNNIVRNNALTLFSNGHWSLGYSFHSDNFQPGSDGAHTMSRLHVYEANWCGDQTSADSHFGIWQDTVIGGDTGMLIRGNVAFNMNGGVGVISTKKVMTYRNTFYQMDIASPFFVFYNPGGNTDYSTGNYIANSIFDYGLGITVGAGNTVTKNHNLGFNAGADASYISTSDPLFVSPNTTNSRNFRLQSGSPARGVGLSPITITSASGSGTSITVNNGDLLTDGWGMVDGDTVTIGATTTRVTSVVSNTVTLAASVSWTVGDPVHWGSSATEDLGAFPYGSTPLTAAALANVGTTWTVTPTGDIRGVWFYVDGIPTTWVSTSPYLAVIASGTVTAKAYALYAQATPVVTAATGAATAPTISAVANQSIAPDSSTGPLAFTVGDATDPVSSLTVSATSSNHTLADDADCVLGGSGSIRTVTITPNASQSGVTTITLIVTNLSLLTATNTFTLTVGSPGPIITGTSKLKGNRGRLK